LTPAVVDDIVNRHSSYTMQTNKLLTLPEAVRRYASDGIQYASGAGLPVGADAIAFGRELLRQERRSLHGIFQPERLCQE
jgi:hypothetical protein